MAGTILELDQLTAETEAAIEQMETGRAATTKLESPDTIDLGEITATPIDTETE
jgi:hypothetical protein